MFALFCCHAAVAGGGRSADSGRAASQGLLGLCRQCPKTHAGDGDRDFQRDGLVGEARADRHIGRALLAIAFEGISADGSAQEQQIVEMRKLALGAGAANVVNASCCGTPNFSD